MEKARRKDGEMLPEYDFSKGVRGQYAQRYAGGSNVFVLDPEVAKVFPNAEAVNSSLRSLAAIIRRRKSLAGQRKIPAVSNRRHPTLAGRGQPNIDTAVRHVESLNR
jgi:hypothetical protein